jgi:hypothetical protein
LSTPVVTPLKKDEDAEYDAYKTRDSFWDITEEEFVGFLANKSTGTGELRTIKNSLLPASVATLIDAILTATGVVDRGVTNVDTMEGLISQKLLNNQALFQVADKYAKKTKVAKVPTLTELCAATKPARGDKNNIGAIRSAHCDNNSVLGSRPMYKLNPAAQGSKQNLYYLWIELTTTFDSNQGQELDSSGLWPKLDDERRAPERIAYVEFTAGAAHTDLPVPKARLVYDYVNNRIYITVHYDSPNHLAYLKKKGIKPYFLVDHDAQTGTEDVTH